MKPVQILLLVIAGALGGAVLTKVWQRPQAQLAAPRMAQVQQPPPVAPAPTEIQQPASAASAPAPATQAAATPPVQPEPEKAEPERAEPPKPSPVTPTRREAPKPLRTTKRPPPPANPRPVDMTARVEPKRVPAPAPEAAPPQDVVVSTPPARPEPEHVTEAPAPPPAPAPNRVTLNAGALLAVRLIDGLSSERNRPGDIFTGTLDKELVADGFVIAERGARVEGRVVNVEQGGKVQGTSSMTVELTRLHTADGQNVAIQTDPFERRLAANHQTDAAKVGGGAVVGAIIGAIAGGGKGAAIGAGVGGGAGAGDVLLTRKPATIPTETRINFRLRAPVNLTERQ
jgi:hypothetical protein